MTKKNRKTLPASTTSRWPKPESWGVINRTLLATGEAEEK
jgi:hypothetical protein